MTAGTVMLGGDVSLDANGGDTASLTITGGGNIVVTADRNIDTEQGDDGSGGSVDFGTSVASATAFGIDLSINTATAAGGGVGGAVTLAGMDGAGGGNLNDVSINTDGPGGDGQVNLGGSFLIDANGPDVADFTISGGGAIVLSASTTIDTEQAGDGDGGAVNFGTSAASAGAAGRSLTINTVSSGGTDGLVTLGDFASAGGSTVAGLDVTAGSVAALGTLTLSGAASISAATGDITFNSIDAGGNNLTLTATAGAINEAGAGDAGADLTGGTMSLTAGTAIGSTAGGIETTAATINATTGAGGITLTESNGATLGTVSATGGGVTITSTTGSLTIGTVSAAGGSAISLTANGGTIADDVNDAVTDIMTTGSASLNALAVGTGAGGSLDTDVGTFALVTALTGDIMLAEANGATLTSIGAGLGNVTITTATGDLLLGNVLAGSSVTLTATMGAIEEAGAGDAASDITGLTINLTAGTAIGATNGGVETTATTLNATSGAGAIVLNETNGATLGAISSTGGGVTIGTTTGSLTIGTVSAAGASAISLTANAGTIVDDASDAVTDVATSGSVSLSAGSIGTGAGGSLDTDVGTFALVTALTGDIVLAEANGATFTSVGAGLGNVTITSASGDILVDNILTSPGTGVVTLTATGGAIEEAGAGDGAADITGATVNLTAATAIGETNGGLETTATTINATAMAGGVTFTETNGATLASVSASGAGNDVSVTSTTGNLTVSSVSAPDEVILTAPAGSILDDGDDLTVISAPIALLTASAAIGGSAASAQLDTTVDVLTAAASAGGVFIGETDGLALTSVTAAGAGSDVVVTSASGDILVGTVTAPDAVTLDAAGGAVNEEGAGDAGADVSAATITLNGASGVGTTGGGIETAGTTLSAATVTGSIVLNESDGATLSMLDANGAGSDVIVSTAIGDLTIAAVEATDTAMLTAANGSILDDGANTTRLAAADATLTAAFSIGVDPVTAQIDTDVTSLTASAAAGSIFLGELNGLALVSVTAGGAGNDITIGSSTGDIAVGAVSATDGVALIAATGSILDDGNDATAITGVSATLRAGASIGTDAVLNDIDTDVLVLDLGAGMAAPGAGDIFVTEADSVLAGSVTAGTGDITIIADTGDITLGALSTMGNATITAVTGSILDDLNQTTVLAANLATLTAAVDIGTNAGAGDGDIDTTITTLDASSTTAGDIFVTETDGVILAAVDTVASDITIVTEMGDLVVGSVTAGMGGTIRLEAGRGGGGGAILDDAGDSIADVTTTGTVLLLADTGIGSGAGGSLDLDVAQLTLATTNDGGVNLALLDPDAGGTTVQDVAATSSGVITLTGISGDVDVTGTVSTGMPGPGGIAIDVMAGSLTLSGVVTTETENITIAARDGVTLSGATAEVSVQGGTGSINIDADSDSAGAGDFVVDDAGGSVASAGGDVSIRAGDLDLLGAVTATTGEVSLLVSDGGGLEFGTVAAAGGMNLSGAELARITAGSLLAGGPASGDITVAGIMPADVSGITGSVRLSAASDGARLVIQGDSTFNTLLAEADDGIDVNAFLNTQQGDLRLNGDLDNAGDSDDRIDIAVSAISSNGLLSLTSTTGGIHSVGALTLNGLAGVSLNSSLTTAGVLTIDADTNVDGTGVLTVASGAAVSTGGSNIDVLAADIDLDGSLNAGAGVVSVERSTEGAIALGDAVVMNALTLDDAEVASISSGGLAVGGANSTLIEVGSLTSTAGVTGTTALSAVGPMGRVRFVNGASSFHTLTVDANRGVDVNADVSTTTGDLTMDGDANSTFEDDDTIHVGDMADLSSAAGVTLASGVVLEAAGGTNMITAGAGGGGDGDISIAVGVSATDNASLHLRAGGGVAVGPIDLDDPDAGAGDLTVEVDFNANLAGQTLDLDRVEAGNVTLRGGADLNDTVLLDASLVASGALLIEDVVTVDVADGAEALAGTTFTVEAAMLRLGGMANLSSGDVMDLRTNLGSIVVNGGVGTDSTISNTLGGILLAPITATNDGNLAITSGETAGSAIVLTTATLNGELNLLAAGGVIAAPAADDSIVLDAARIGVEGTMRVAAGGTITLNGPAVIRGTGATFETGAGDLLFNDRVDGQTARMNPLTVATGGGSVTFIGEIGRATALGAVTINSASNVTFVSDVTADSLRQLAGTGTTTFMRSLGTLGSGGVSVVGNNFSFELPVVTSEGGNMSVDNAGMMTTGAGAVLLVSGGFSQTGAGAVQLGAGIEATSGGISFAAPVTALLGLSTLDFRIRTAMDGAIAFSNSLTTSGTTASGLQVFSEGAGSVSFGGAVTLSDLLSASSASGAITFDAPIDGTGEGIGALSLSTGNDVTFAAAATVGATNRLRELYATGDSIQLSSVGVHNGDITLRPNSVNSTMPIGSLSVPNVPDGVIRLLGNLSITGVTGSIGLNFVPAGSPEIPTGADGRPTVPSTASIFTDPAVEMDLVLSAPGDVTMGMNEKLAVYGNLQIEAGGSVTLGDVAALRSITVNAPTINILSRPGATALTTRGTVSDQRGSIVAAGAIDLNGAVLQDGSGGGGGDLSTLFANNNGARGSVPEQFSFLELSTPLVSADSLLFVSMGTSTAITPGAIGVSDQEVTTALAGAIPRESQSGDVTQEAAMTASQRDEIERLSIRPREITAAELLEFLVNPALYDDAPREPAQRTFEPAINRLPVSVVNKVLVAYNDAFFRMQDGDRTDISPQIQIELTAAVRRFRGDATAGAIDPGAFRAYLEDNPSESLANEHIRNISVFLERLGLLGLSPREERIARTALLQPVVPDGVSLAQFEEILRNPSDEGEEF
jgi:hypothetical protein